MKINFTFKQFIVKNLFAKLVFMLTAILFMGLTLSILIEIGWGTDPASFMNLNVANLFGWTLGNAQVFDYMILFVITILFGAQMIGFGTLANMFLIGYIADFFRFIWKLTGFSSFIANSSIGVTVLIFVLTLILFVFACSVYMNSKLGVAPYDACPIIIGNALPNVPSFLIRILFDFLAVGIGLLTGLLSKTGIQGSALGSVCMCIMLGPTISFVGKIMKKLFPIFSDSE